MGMLNTTPAVASSVAVMPFENLSGGDDQKYFSEGLTSDVRAALAHNDQLQVLAAASSEAASDKKWDAVTAARTLGVGFLLEGSVRRSGDLVRVAAELIDGKTGFSRWSNTFDRKMTDVFAVQSEIARIVTNALLATIVTIAPPPGGTTDVPAYEAFLKGRSLFFNGGDEASDRAALKLFETAIAADPNFADAYAMRARSLSVIAAEHAKGSEVGTLQAAAVVSARRAVELAPDMASGHLALGNAIFNGQKDVLGARPSYEKAYALGHGDANIVLAYALYCARDGRADEAKEAAQRSMSLDPLNPRTYRAAGSIAYAARRYRDAVPLLERALSINPKLSNTYFYIGNCMYMLGQYANARANFAKEPQAMFRLYGGAIAEHRLGDDAAAKQAMAQLISEVGDSALYQQAEVLAQWGDIGGALTALERARAVGDSGLTYLKVDPMVDPLRAQPRFAAIYKIMNFG
jgi:TolB-like protein/tetratricopeptide (TPR) repeat protein